MTRQPPTPRLQIALDTLDLPAALGPLQQAAPYVDVIECGTILVLCEGFHAVRAIRALFPDKQILADVRIAEAGSKIARLAFEAGADLVSCVAGASMSTIRQVCQVADELGGAVQVELADEWFDAERARAWRQARVDELAAMGFTVTITGSLSPVDLPAFAGREVGIVITGRAIVAAEEPAHAAAELRATLEEVWT